MNYRDAEVFSIKRGGKNALDMINYSFWEVIY